jgi:hypothetical protein
MANVIEYFSHFDKMQELSDDLDEVMSSIVYAGRYKDRKYINVMQKKIKRKYGMLVDDLRGEGCSSEAIGHIIDAYRDFMDFKSEDGEFALQDSLHEHLLWYDEFRGYEPDSGIAKILGLS